MPEKRAGSSGGDGEEQRKGRKARDRGWVMLEGVSEEAQEALAEVKSERRRLFCVHYVKDFDGPKAAQRAGFSANSRNEWRRIMEDECCLNAIRCLVNDLTVQALEETRCDIATRTRVLELDTIIAEATPFDFITPLEGNTSMAYVKRPEDIPAIKQHALESLKMNENGIVVEVKLKAAHPSLSRLAQFHRLIGPLRRLDVELEMEAAAAGKPQEAKISEGEHAARAAQWLEDVGRQLETDSVAQIVKELREAGGQKEIEGKRGSEYGA